MPTRLDPDDPKSLSMAHTEETPLLVSGASSSSSASSTHSADDDARPGAGSQSEALSLSPDQISPGAARMTAIAARITPTQRASLFFSIFLIGYAYGLESQVRPTYQPYATSSFGLHSYSSTINVLRSVIAVAAQPSAAKIADVFGRLEVVAVSTVLYTLGMAIEASASSIEAFCVGGVIYQVGYTAIVLLMEVLIADFSSMRARVFFSYIPALPFLVNTWISGNITEAVLSVTTWRWGLGMWCFIYPLASLPLLVTLYTIERRVGAAARDDDDDEARKRGARMRASLYQQLDLVGLVLVIAIFSLILAPFTLAGGTASHWRNPSIIVPLVIGLLCVPAFIYREKAAEYPLVPFPLLYDRGVWAALAVRTLLNFTWSVQGNYLYTVLVVAFDFHITAATRILSFFSFFGVLSGVIIGVAIYRIRRLKYIIVAGTCIFMVAFILLIRNPGDPSKTAQHGLIGAQILLGLAGGLFAYPTQASIQATVTRDHVAVLTSLYLSFYNLGNAFGTSLSGLIWTQVLYPTLHSNLAFQSNETLARAVYDSPFSVVPNYPVGTEVRTAIIDSYQHVQRLLCVAGLCLCVPMIGFAMALRNPKLSEHQTQPDAELRATASNSNE